MSHTPHTMALAAVGNARSVSHRGHRITLSSGTLEARQIGQTTSRAPDGNASTPSHPVHCTHATEASSRVSSALLMPEGQPCTDGSFPVLCVDTVSYTHLRAHETPEHLVCRLLLEKKKTTINSVVYSCLSIILHKTS
eukprot:TRINITY_DN61040_c0_g2_i1.p3 TRINITY_DN61040_c0_g2~~TRINITY_DN61040_c0_g2_i1.p3  ORF type:complete len:138 (-),score=23.01 TRINITY_DN61040_c0_g2_i1:16-429(-)